MNMKKSNSLSLKYNILIYLILFTLFVVLLLGLIQYYLSDILYEKYQIKDINNIAYEIKEKDINDLHEYLIDVVYDNSLCIEYKLDDGSINLYNDRSPGCVLGKNIGEIINYKDEFENSSIDMKKTKFINDDYHSDGILYGIKVDNGSVFLFTMLSKVDKNEMLISSQLIYITLIGIVIAFIVCVYVSRIISKPIIKITEDAKKVADGNYNVEFKNNGIKEIDELSNTLNYLEKEVSKTDQYRRDLMANVSHDLKTPLTMIKAYAEMVRDISYDNKEKREEHLNVIINETDRLNLLVNDILLLSKEQSNVDSLNLEVYDLKEEFDKLLKNYSILKETEDYNIELVSPKNIFIKADKNKLNQALYNLINNAINYTGDNKTVKIEVVDNKKEYLVKVIDSGKGIEEKDLNNIWNRYYKNEKNHKRNKIGTGLGLSIVKSIFDSHKFKYGVDSKLNVGTTFYVYIKKENIK